MDYWTRTAPRRRLALACAGVVAGAIFVTPAQASVPHVVQPGETLWSIAAGSNLTTRTVAAFNGLSETSQVVAGQTVNVPSVDEGAAALASAGIVPGASTIPAASGVPVGMSSVPSPYGDVPLDPAAADSFNAMRQDSLANHGVDLYPAGQVSGYRTYEEQAAMYEAFLNGTGAPANPPGTSSHEFGAAVDLAEPVMRDVVDQIGYAYGWAGTIPSEWWHVAYGG